MDSLYSWQGTGFQIPILKKVPASFAKAYFASVEKYSTHVFASCHQEEGQIRRTYQEFAEDVSQARAYLRRIRRPENDTAATHAGNTYIHLVFIVAVLLEGLTLCPISPDDPPQRREEKLTSLGASPIFLYSGNFQGESRWPKARMEDALLEKERITDEVPPAGQRPFIFIFTSGSTGHSKIVQLLEYNLLVNVDALVELHKLGPGRVVGTSMPIFHVNALGFSFLSTLLSGASFVLFERFHFGRVLRAVAEERINILSVFPEILKQLLNRRESIKAADLSSLNYLVTAASALSPAAAKDLVDNFPVRVVQGYGLSEAVNFSAVMPVDLSPDEHRFWMTNFERPSIGKALRGNDIFILDENGDELMAGKTGEVCLRGHNLMAGYRKPASNEEIFAGQYLHTGDLGFFAENGTGEKYFFITGRKKDVIKRFGETVSLLEIDEAFGGELPYKAIAVGFENQLSGEEVGAVIQAGKEFNITTAEIGKLFQGRLPQSHIPKVVIITTAPLRTSSGKPCRWKFRARFEGFREKVLGSGMLLIDQRELRGD